MSKRKLFLIAISVCLISVISLGTLAWFSDSDVVNNKFMIADSSDNTADDIFSIDVWEIDPESNEKEETGHTYEDVLPGDSLTKDVFVKNTGYYDQYVRVIVTISDAKAWLNTVPENTDGAAYMTQIFKGLDLTKWSPIYNSLTDTTEITDDTELVYVLYYKDVLKASDDAINVFDSIEIPTTLTREQAAAFDNEFTINVRAQAVQTENVVPSTITEGKSAAWEAFKEVGLSINA